MSHVSPSQPPAGRDKPPRKVLLGRLQVAMPTSVVESLNRQLGPNSTSNESLWHGVKGPRRTKVRHPTNVFIQLPRLDQLEVALKTGAVASGLTPCHAGGAPQQRRWQRADSAAPDPGRALKEPASGPESGAG
jgi:hypothetical protein